MLGLVYCIECYFQTRSMWLNLFARWKMFIRKNGCILLSLSRPGGLFKQIPPCSNSVCVLRPLLIIAVLLPSRRALPFYMTLLPTCRGKQETNLDLTELNPGIFHFLDVFKIYWITERILCKEDRSD